MKTWKISKFLFTAIRMSRWLILTVMILGGLTKTISLTKNGKHIDATKRGGQSSMSSLVSNKNERDSRQPEAIENIQFDAGSCGGSLIDLELDLRTPISSESYDLPLTDEGNCMETSDVSQGDHAI